MLTPYDACLAVRHKYQFHSLWLDPTGDRSHERARYYDTDVVVVCFILSLHSFHFFIILCYTLYYVISFYFYPLCEKKIFKKHLLAVSNRKWWCLIMTTISVNLPCKSWYESIRLHHAHLDISVNLPCKSWYESIRLHYAHLDISFKLTLQKLIRKHSVASCPSWHFDRTMRKVFGA